MTNLYQALTGGSECLGSGLSLSDVGSGKGLSITNQRGDMRMLIMQKHDPLILNSVYLRLIISDQTITGI